MTFAAALLCIAGHAHATALKVGVFPGFSADTLEVAAAEANTQGLEVKVVEFTDWVTPNAALDAGDLDLNYFQHQAFLDNAIRQRGYKLQSVGLGVLSNIGLYAHKANAVDQIAEGSKVAIHNDAANQARVLNFLSQLGLISLRAEAAPQFTLDDITANPKKLKFLEVEGTQLVHAFADVEVTVLYPFRLVQSGQNELANSAIAYSNQDDVYYTAKFVSRHDNAEDPRIQQLIQIYQTSEKVRQAIHQSFANNEKIYSLPWLNQPQPNQ